MWVSRGLKLTEKLKVPDLTSFKLGLFRQLLLQRLECSVEILELAFSTYILYMCVCIYMGVHIYTHPRL